MKKKEDEPAQNITHLVRKKVSFLTPLLINSSDFKDGNLNESAFLDSLDWECRAEFM